MLLYGYGLGEVCATGASGDVIGLLFLFCFSKYTISDTCMLRQVCILYEQSSTYGRIQTVFSNCPQTIQSVLEN